MTPGDPSVRGPDDTMATRRGEALVSMLIVALVVLFALGRQWWRVLASSPTQARCEQLAERYVEQASRARYEDVDARAIAEAQAQRGELRARRRQCRRNRTLLAAMTSHGLGYAQRRF